MKIVTKEMISKIVTSIINETEISDELYGNNLVEMGLDSIRFIQCIVSLEEAFECEIPDDKLFFEKMNTINKMYDVLLSIDESKNETNTTET